MKCSVKTGSGGAIGVQWQAHWKERGVNCASNNYQLVCSGPVYHLAPPGASQCDSGDLPGVDDCLAAANSLHPNYAKQFTPPQHAYCGHGDGSTCGNWHLAPPGDNICDYGEPAGVDECVTAATMLSRWRKKNPNFTPPQNGYCGNGSGSQCGQKGGVCGNGGWGDVPRGCSVRTGSHGGSDYKAHFKEKGVNCPTIQHQLVCSGGGGVCGAGGLWGEVPGPNWGEVPRGCSVKSGQTGANAYKMHWKEMGVNCPSTKYQLVCTGPVLYSP